MLMLKRLLRSEKMSQKDLAAQLGIDEASMSLIVNGRRDMSIEMRKAIDTLFGAEKVAQFDIQPITQPTQVQATIYPSGVIDDLREEMRSEMPQPKPEEVEVVEPEEVELKETVILTPEIVNQPGIDIRKELEEDNLPVTTKYTQDIVPLHDAKVYLENDEMAPEIEANDPVLIRFMDSTAVVPGRMYFVDLYRGGVVRWVFPQEDGSLILRSTNTPDMHVPADSVKSISEVVAIWKRPKSMQTERITIMEELRRRDDQMDKQLELLKEAGQREDRLISMLEKNI